MMDPFLVAKLTKPEQEEIDVVADLERELRSEKKEEISTNQSQELGASSSILPDLPGQRNTYLENKVKKYAVFDQVPPPSSSVLGDFSRLIDMQSQAPMQNSGLGRNQMMTMAYSTLQNKTSEAQRIVESQLAYNLSASSFGLEKINKKTYKRARGESRMLTNTMY